MKTLLKIVLLAGILISISKNANAQKPITWQRTYGDGNIDYGYSIVQTPDEGYIAVGRKRINTTSFMFAMRLNKYGDTIWTKTFLANEASQIEMLSDSNYLICSGFLNDPLIKINIDGNILWTKNNSGGYIKPSIYSGFFLDRESSIIKYNDSGQFIWNFDYEKYLNNGNIIDFAIRQDNSILIIGRIEDTLSIFNLFIIRTNDLGHFISLKKFSSNFLPAKIICLEFEKFVYTGYSVNGASTVMYDTSCNLIWSKTYDNGLPEYFETNSFIKTNDNGYAFAGTYSNGNFDYYMRILKADSIGNEQFRKLYGFGDADFGSNLRQTKDTGYVIIGIRDNYNLGDIYIVKADKTGYANPPVSIINYSSTTLSEYQLFQNFPNPFNPKTTLKFFIPQKDYVKLKVYNLMGFEVKSILNRFIFKGYYEINFDGSNLASGVYYCQLETKNFTKTIKMLLIK
ncbi:MAG: hypothetical protein HGGPFJEG_03154 [Ignavibacteria bacterium]|nr:hypothetical protein [Ignavibacteria bacterium]